MRFVFRVDSSTRIGTGHLMRCLTLASALKNEGAEIYFISRELPGNLCHFIENKGYKVYRLPYNNELVDNKNYKEHESWLGVNWSRDTEETSNILISIGGKIDCFIVDHYAIDSKWERKIRPFVKKIMVIDDLADRSHDCDILLDQNYYPNLENRYDGLVPGHCKKLLGPKYALLRPEFIEARKNLRVRDGRVNKILIFFGGTDPTNETEKALEAIRLLKRPDIGIDVVVGEANQNKEKIKEICNSMENVVFHCQVENMAQLMVEADLAIGAGGATTWERCYLGLPTITVVVADNQAEIAKAVAQTGAIWNLGLGECVSSYDYFVSINKGINNPILLKSMERSALKLMENIMTNSKMTIMKALME